MYYYINNQFIFDSLKVVGGDHLPELRKWQPNKRGRNILWKVSLMQKMPKIAFLKNKLKRHPEKGNHLFYCDL